MGRAIRAIRTRDLPTLFSFFGLQTKDEVLESRREEISARFAVEVGEILRLCTRHPRAGELPALPRGAAGRVRERVAAPRGPTP